ncbi:wax ester/triacylglycerol synthase family O-acyltransferase [Mycobacterium marinum]|uniref:wax ester/triacylglycerol synthase family O-acyltransferase n=1 Tax=Mycobacterium marinum TaxID=1781 RepID=UPI0023593BB1|nr:wax ester/triacylglycerol synthase family O-acyltransferase [Mycobacterium marinum]WCS20614.1 wax ester/triacylglycerol synthase family O-acyltransferase [Mycobacterium marinum]
MTAPIKGVTRPQRLSGADAFMLGMETPRAYMHTFKVAIIDPSTDAQGWSFDRFYAEAARRIHLLPMLRWKCVESPLGLNHPYWVEDPDFELRNHIRRVACPAPGDHKSLCAVMTTIYSAQLERDRPLWLMWVVEGLAEGKVALVMLVHHAYVDGVGAAWLMQQFYQPHRGVGAAEAPDYRPAPLPSWPTRLGWAVRDWPETVIGNLPKVATGLWRKFLFDRKRKSAGLPAHPSARQMQRTPINVNLSAGRTFVCDSVPLQHFSAVAKALGVTINDVFSSCAAGALRRLLVDLDYDPDTHPLIGATPFAGERPLGMQGLGNYATVDYCWLRSDIADPSARLQASREANTQMKGHIKAVKEAGADFNSVMQVLPPWGIKIIRKAIHRSRGRFGFFGNVVLSNVPGPKEALYLDHWKVSNWFSTGQIADGTALNITMWSYCGQANICILADRAVLDDGWRMFDYLVDELNSLTAVASTKEAA